MSAVFSALKRISEPRAEDVWNRHLMLYSPIGKWMIESQPAALLLEESGTFEVAAPIDFDQGASGEYSSESNGLGEIGDRFIGKRPELIAWITGRMSVSF